jgi:hypothetical protein
MTRGSALRLVLLALAIPLFLWLFVACAGGAADEFDRGPPKLRGAHGALRGVTPGILYARRVTGDPRDEEAWGFRASPVGNALWKEPEVFYAVGDRTRCDQVRAGLGTPTEECWGPVSFRRE